MNIPKKIAKGKKTKQFRVGVATRLLKGVEQKGFCWIWRGHKDEKGYGQIHAEGKTYWAHRVSFAMFKGNIGAEDVVHHTCSNTSCINPKHLKIISSSENSIRANKSPKRKRKSSTPF